MIMLNEEIIINVADSAKYGLNPDKWYKVIGTQSRNKENKESKKMEAQDMFLVVNDQGKLMTLFPTKCEIRILSKKYIDPEKG
jgi:hypothetical protein